MPARHETGRSPTARTGDEHAGTHGRLGSARAAWPVGEDEPVHADIGQRPVCLVRTGGAVHAVRDECTHQAVPLSEGKVVGGAIECWLHAPAGREPDDRRWRALAWPRMSGGSAITALRASWLSPRPLSGRLAEPLNSHTFFMPGQLPLPFRLAPSLYRLMGVTWTVAICR
jgi:Rieske 2Fe-2S protein